MPISPRWDLHVRQQRLLPLLPEIAGGTSRPQLVDRYSGRDITERKGAEAEAEQRRKEVTHLTRVGILGELSGALAHELNQPLTAILSNAQAAQRLLAKDPVALDEVREILGDISSDDKRAGNVVARLRALMKKGEVKSLPVNLNDRANDVLELVHSELIERNVAVTTRLGPSLPDVRGDRVQLQQVLLNLIVNACEAMSDTDSRDRSLVVSTTHDGDSNLRLTVADRGPGISSDLVDRIFEPFRNDQGSGARPRTIDLPFHCRRPWRAALGRQQRRPRRHLFRFAANPHRRARIGDETSWSLALAVGDDPADG